MKTALFDSRTKIPKRHGGNSFSRAQQTEIAECALVLVDSFHGFRNDRITINPCQTRHRG